MSIMPYILPGLAAETEPSALKISVDDTGTPVGQ